MHCMLSACLVPLVQVTLSSLNRHAVATREDVGTPKATCLGKHFRRILPEVGAGGSLVGG